MKKILIILLVLSSPSWATTVTIPTTYQSNGTVTSTNLNGNFNALANTINGGLDNNNMNTTNGYRVPQTVAVLPSAGTQGAVYFLTSDNSLNFDNGSTFSKVATNGILMPTGAVFFMITGSCPSGSTDVSATYSNLFLRVNATGGSTGGADTHTHAAGSYVGPAHTHSIPSLQLTTPGPGGSAGVAQGGNYYSTTDASTTGSSGTGAVTGTSAAGSNVPSYVTAKLCQVS